MQIRLASLATIAYAVAALTSCDDPTGLERTLTPYLATQSTPNAPSGLSATAVIPDKINLVWADNSKNETSFEIYRSSTGPDGFYLLTTTLANVTTYADVALEPVSQFCYKVQAVAKGRAIGVTGTACATPPVRPVAASSASASSQGALVTITWVDNSTVESGFRIESAAISAATLWTAAATVGANVTSAQQTAAIGVQTCYRVVAFNAYGDAAPSNATCAIPLAAPTLNAPTLFDVEIDLTWSDVNGEDWYEISRSEPGFDWVVIATTYTGYVEYRDQAVRVGTAYSYRVRAVKSGGFSDYSAIVSATAANARPRAPEWLSIYVFALDALEVYWDVPQAWWDGTSSITGWRVERSTSPFTTWTTVSEGNQYYFDDYGLNPDETVCYRVIAGSAFPDTDPSPVGCATPSYDYYGYGGASANRSAPVVGGVNGSSVRLIPQKPLVNFGVLKAAFSNPRVKSTRTAASPSENRTRRTH